MEEQYNDAYIDEVTDNIDSICKDAVMMDRMLYSFTKKLMDRFSITAEEALAFIVDTAQEAYDFALEGESK